MLNHQGTKILTTARLTLRPFTADDAPAMFRNWASDPEVTKYLTWPTHESVEISEMVLTDWCSHYTELDFYQWAIVPKDIDEPIGTISVVGSDEKTKKIHIGYCIGSKWWNFGYTSEAFAAIISFFFEQVEAKRIESQHDPKNVGSGKVMEKCRLIYEGTLRNADWNNRGIVDARMYAILASDYLKNR